uniref:Uncharacterized protein n=1 Tax=Rhipicephalus zambeziensis TaxID=60191 RepID=A0A224YDZ7_9ACAR
MLHFVITQVQISTGCMRSSPASPGQEQALARKHASGVRCRLTAGVQAMRRARNGQATRVRQFPGIAPEVPERQGIFQGHRARHRKRIAALLLTDVR